MIIDLAKPVESSEDTALLSKILSALVGQPCLKAVFSYGGELMVHFGAPLPYSHPKLGGEIKGSWILGVRASAWRLLLPDPPRLVELGWPEEVSSLPPSPADGKVERVEQEEDEEESEKLLRALAGEFVVSAFPLWFLDRVGLILHFRSGANLVVCPKKDSDEEEGPLADWELFTPYHTYLRCGPGLRWSYLASDEVASRKGEGAA